MYSMMLWIVIVRKDFRVEFNKQLTDYVKSFSFIQGFIYLLLQPNGTITNGCEGLRQHVMLSW